jgi:hypothetical protein
LNDGLEIIAGKAKFRLLGSSGNVGSGSCKEEDERVDETHGLQFFVQAYAKYMTIEYIYLYHKTYNSGPKGPDDADGEVLLSVSNPKLTQNMPEYALLKGVTEFLVDLGGVSSSSLSICRPKQAEVISKAFPDSPDFVLVFCGPNGSNFIDQIVHDFSLLNQAQPISLTNYHALLPLLEGVLASGADWRPRGIEFAPVDRLTFLEIFGFLARLRERHRDIKSGVFFAPNITHIDQLANSPIYFVAGDLSQHLVAALSRSRGCVRAHCHCVLLRPDFVLAFTGAPLEAVTQDAAEILKSIDLLERAASRMTAHFSDKSSKNSDFLYLNSVNFALRSDGTPDAALRFANTCPANDSLVLRNLGGTGRTWQAVRRSLDRMAVLELPHCRGIVDAVEKLDLWQDRILGSVFMV